MTDRIKGAAPRTIILDEVTGITEEVFDAAQEGGDRTGVSITDEQGNVVHAETAEPEKPPFKIAHLELPDIFRTIGAVLPLTKGRPATIETMEWAFRPVPPANLPEGVTPEISLDCVLWAIEINNQRKADKARHMAAGATIGYGAHLVKTRFKLVGKKMFGRKSSSARAKMAKLSRKRNR